MTQGGLLIHGLVIPVEGRTIIGPHEQQWSELSPGDCKARDPAHWLRQWMVHKTIADDPEVMRPGAGPAGMCQRTAQMWEAEFKAKGRYAGAGVLTGADGVSACLCDLALVETFHATASNPWSIGHEICELPGGVVFELGMDASVDIILNGCEAAGIQWQMQRRGTYTGHPIKRMDEHGPTPGGPDMVGIFGHRLNTEQRGKWDPGEIIWDKLAARGVMEFDFSKGEDRAFWMAVQEDLRMRKLYSGVIDGVPGPGTTAALRLDGYRSGIYALGKAAA